MFEQLTPYVIMIMMDSLLYKHFCEFKTTFPNFLMHLNASLCCLHMLVWFSFLELQIYLFLLNKKYNTMLLHMDLKYIVCLYLLPTRVLHVCQTHL